MDGICKKLLKIALRLRFLFPVFLEGLHRLTILLKPIIVGLPPVDRGKEMAEYANGVAPLVEDDHAEHRQLQNGMGIVKKVYAEERRIDVEDQQGGILHKVLVLGPHLPPVHVDDDCPSYVVLLPLHSHAEDLAAFPLVWRRLKAPQDVKNGSQEKERHLHAIHVHCERAGDITIRVTDDNRYLVETEHDDYIEIDQELRTIGVIAPTVFIGTKQDTRIEYVEDEHVHVVISDIRLGKADADQQVILGNLFRTLYNAHTHTGIVRGGAITDPPVIPMTDAQLSDVLRTVKSGE